MRKERKRTTSSPSNLRSLSCRLGRDRDKIECRLGMAQPFLSAALRESPGYPPYDGRSGAPGAHAEDV
jgi:hypothetical protein